MLYWVRKQGELYQRETWFELENKSGKLGLTMRQPFLGKIGPDRSWIEDDVRAARGETKKDKKKKK
jgi:hypothetical protein